MNYKEVIESKYDRQAWQQLLHDIFHGNDTFYNTPASVAVSSHLAKQALLLGKISLSDGQVLGVYEVELSDNVDIERNRAGIRNLLTADWQARGFAGAFMFCFRKDESVLRFSYVSETWAFDKDGFYNKISTSTRRFTYLLGEGRGCRTAVDQFTALKNSQLTLSDITNAFSVEALTKEFYKDLFAWYQWAVDPESHVTFPNDPSTEDDDREDLETKVIRMITRIMFVWFIKQKELVPQRLFDKDYLSSILVDFDPLSATIGNYYNAILQNLFFATLNRAIEDENGKKRGFATSSNRDIKTLYRYAELFKISTDEVVSLFADVPFLNGGLFECLDKTRKIDGVDNPINYDGFSRNDRCFADGRFRYRAVVPNVLFFEPERGLISILSRYNFTIQENSPEEQQVALDPELLGKVFENLLGAYNPETKETARNQSGSFYTPREIVNYMVDESLIAYLGDDDLTRSLFAPDFTPNPAHADDYRRLALRLACVKVLDPACGSGAFPMGLLNRMVEIFTRLDPDRHPYGLKLSIIENSLYGSDIQNIATQITKLRFFISLICDCEKDPSKPNFGIPTLPNLETKFVAANSLIALKVQRQGSLFDNREEIDPLKEELKSVRREHFVAKTASRKTSLREKDHRLREQLATLLTQNADFAPADAKQLADWNPYDQNAVAPFFDADWMFGVADGFDIIIGNPPYVQLQNNGGLLAQQYADCDYKSFARTGDVYCLFYERGLQLLKTNGHLCFITSNKWMRAGYGERLRGFLAKNSDPRLLIDFAGTKIFESATVDTNILLLAKAPNSHHTLCAVTSRQNRDSVKNLSLFVHHAASVCDFPGPDSWVILSPVEQSIKRKIEAVGTPLKDWDINIYRGVLTGYNDAFIITTERRDAILAACQGDDERRRTEELIRPILRGRDIKRYGYEWAGLWLIATHNGIKGQLERIHIEDYPAVKAHLDKYWDEISKRSDKGDTPYNLRNCAYWGDFMKPKIVYMEIQTDNPHFGYHFPCFSYDDRNSIVLNTAYIMSSSIVDVRYVLGILNSSTGRMIARLYVTQLQERQYRMLAQYLATFPIPQSSDSMQEEICSKVQRRLLSLNVEVEDEIDRLVYKIYHFDNEEIKYIENLNRD